MKHDMAYLMRSASQMYSVCPYVHMGVAEGATGATWSHQ